MKNSNDYTQDNDLESTLTGFDHHAYEVTFKDGPDEIKENYIARNVPHLVYVLGKESRSFPIKDIRELAYCPNVFMFLNTERGLADLNSNKERSKSR